MKLKVLLAAVIAALAIQCAYAQRTNISVADGIQCYRENESLYVSSDSEKNISVYTAVYKKNGSLKSVAILKKTVQTETEFAQVYPQELEKSEYYKIFVWDNDMMPVNRYIEHGDE